MTDAAPTAAPRRVDGSMSLLVDMMTNTLDASYADAAARRTARAVSAGSAAGDGTAPGGPSLRSRVTAVVLLLALGLVTGTAAAQVRKRDAAGSTLRAQLAGDVQRRTADSDDLAAQAARLRQEVTAQQDAVLRSNGAGAVVAKDLAALQLAVGVGPVVGPGLVVRLDDAAAGTSDGVDRGGQVNAGRVQDRDLQDAVNGLWAAGAEAVAINGLRLSSLTAIRSAGEAILVDYRPISPPYTLRAIGNAGTLEAAFADGAAGRRLSTYTSLYGISMVLRRTDSQTLPGAGTPSLRLASAVQGPS